ncbi:MAG: hypothetical protein KAZ18_04530 [Acinetobacter sp.]|nr:hypothetical protein [Acinetobacter sp.]
MTLKLYNRAGKTTLDGCLTSTFNSDYLWEDYILSPKGRVAIKELLRGEASKAALNECNIILQEGRVYTEHVGHVPDTTWMGTPQPYSWLGLDAHINMYRWVSISISY